MLGYVPFKPKKLPGLVDFKKDHLFIISQKEIDATEDETKTFHELRACCVDRIGECKFRYRSNSPSVSIHGVAFCQINPCGKHGTSYDCHSNLRDGSDVFLVNIGNLRYGAFNARDGGFETLCMKGPEGSIRFREKFSEKWLGNDLPRFFLCEFKDLFRII